MAVEKGARDGAVAIVEGLAASGVDLWLANPGTTEMPLVAALDRVAGVRAVLGLFEGVCTGAADGYARTCGSPAATLLHLGPGLANGLANLHNARRAHSPIVNVVGDHASYHLAADAPLTSDIFRMAESVSGWVHSTRDADGAGDDAVAAVEAATTTPNCVATLVVPHDAQWTATSAKGRAYSRPREAAIDEDAVSAAAKALVEHERPVLLLGGKALDERGLRAAGRIAAATGARLVHETFPAVIARGAGLVCPERLPYFPEQVLGALDGTEVLVLAGARSPVSFFAYPELPSSLVPDGCDVVSLATAADDVGATLEALAAAVDAPAEPATVAPSMRPAVGSGPLDPDKFGQVVAALQPEGAIVIDEAATSGLGWFIYSQSAPPHRAMMLTGGAIGQGLPCAVGAALAAPDAKVIALQADGSGLYTLQSLWTMARENLDVTVVVCANKSYRILQLELLRAGIAEPGAAGRGLTDLGSPELDWVSLARGLGVAAQSVATTEEFASAFERALAEPGPQLIEAVLP